MVGLRNLGILQLLLSVFREIERRIHDWSMRTLEVTALTRATVVREMLTQRRRDAVEYWFYLMASMGIATLGLATGSTAVVIGAMLVAPLMGPIVHLGMGLTVGTPVLTIRSLIRVVGSVAAVVLGSAALTLLLPFHEVTSEIASRTQPTVLDLALAVFVALVAALAAVRPQSEVSSVASGAAIGIALIPPLCVIGYGIGTRAPDIAGGGSLLFVTNLTSIVFVSVVFFWLLGFEQVDTVEWDTEALAQTRPGSFTRRTLSAADRLFGSRRSRAFRVLIPLLLVAAVAVPLKQGLDQVAWEIRARSAVSRLINQVPKSGATVRSDVDVSGGGVFVRLYLVGDPEMAADTERALTAQIAAATGVIPDLRVIAMPDIGAVRQALGSESRPATDPAVDTEAEVARLLRSVETGLRSAWPESFGGIAGWRLELADGGPPAVLVDHWGAPIGDGAETLLASALSGRAAVNLTVASRGLGSATEAAPHDSGVEWLPHLVRAVQRARTLRSTTVCVRIPGEARQRRSATVRQVAEAVRAELALLPEERVGIAEEGDEWEVRLTPEACQEEVAER